MSLTRVAVCWSLLGLLAAAPSAWAQESKSGALAKQLAAALDAAKLDSVAAKDPNAADTFIAALYFPGAQLLVVSAKYTAPQLLDARLSKKEYRDTYIDLSSASVPESKVFVQDALADGLKAKRDDNQPFDIYEVAGQARRVRRRLEEAEALGAGLHEGVRVRRRSLLEHVERAHRAAEEDVVEKLSS